MQSLLFKQMECFLWLNKSPGFISATLEHNLKGSMQPLWKIIIIFSLSWKYQELLSKSKEWVRGKISSISVYTLSG